MIFKEQSDLISGEGWDALVSTKLHMPSGSQNLLLAQIAFLNKKISLQDKLLQSKEKDPDKYYFPSEIADDIGYSANYIISLRCRGCHFHGRKTTIRAVRECLSRMEAEPALQQLSGRLY